MSKQQFSRTAVQLPPQESGVLKWQRDFWLALVEHALEGRLGAPDLSRLEGFFKPAVIRHAVTTPELWHSFDKYNAEKPYHLRVRPFGFMVMFQPEEIADTSVYKPAENQSRKRATAMLRVIAPFNRDPAVAARHAFDRDTGKPVSSKHLKTYARTLRHYYDHPEAKFLNGERADRGQTARRHIIVHSVRHIGKEANRLDSQTMMGVDPEAQAEFVSVSENQTKRLKVIKIEMRKCGPSLLARQARLSRQHLSKLLAGEVTATEAALSKIEQALAAIDVVNARKRCESDRARAWLRAECERISMRKVAQNLSVNPGYLSRMIAGTRPIPGSIVRAINTGTSQPSDELTF